MLPFFGIIFVIACVLGSFIAMGGKAIVLWQPWEYVIIIGAAFGAMVIGNSGNILKRALSDVCQVFKGSVYTKKDFVELLILLHKIMKIARSKGTAELEKDIENPFESELFNAYPSFILRKKAVVFLCDYIRMIMMGTDKPDPLYNIMEEEISTFRKEKSEISTALNSMADSLPAIGIVAAVLGVIKTMGAMSEPPAILGKMIAAALIGTFLGVFLSYGIVGPIARRVSLIHQEEALYFECIREALVAFVSGISPSIAIEQARKVLPETLRADFYELEKATQEER